MKSYGGMEVNRFAKIFLILEVKFGDEPLMSILLNRYLKARNYFYILMLLEILMFFKPAWTHTWNLKLLFYNLQPKGRILG